jgi:hypothetical protein
LEGKDEGVLMRWVGHVARIGEKVDACRILVAKGKIQLRRPRSRWVDTIKMDLGENG